MKVVIVGGGFAGLKLARSLNNKPGVEVTLLDKVNYHQFQPLFYQVATASLDASNISFPLRKVFQKSKNVRVRLATVQAIDHAAQQVITDIGHFDYDELVLATGADTNFFGNTQLQQAAFPMKSTVEAIQLRHHLLSNLEEAVQVKGNEALLRKKLSIVVVGGGPTGVEVSGALAEMKNYILPKDYPELDINLMQIYLLEGLDKTLAAMSPQSSEQSKGYLEKLGVTVLTNTIVKDYDGEQVTLNNGESIATETVIWAAGIKGNVPEGFDKTIIVRGNRITVNRFSQVQGFENIYALGDVAYMETPLYPKGHPQVANVAINQAKNLAHNLLKKIKATPTAYTQFEYHDKGSMATVGRNLAVVDIPKPRLHFKGFFAWVIWMSIHLFLLVGVKNRIQVFINWIYNYMTFDQNLRLIFKDFYRQRKKTVNS